MEELGLAKYDSMCRAIAECHHVDEVKSLRDKARALEVYAAQAMNRESERKACEIRIRAERRTGEILKEMKAAGTRSSAGRPKTSDHPTINQTLQGLGITREQSSDWQALADVPKETFEKHVSDSLSKPTTAGIIAAHKPTPVPKVSNDALNFWG